jgi:hypothetical protein
MRHKSYGQLKFIIIPIRPYHTVSGDFIVGLLLIAINIDAALIFIYKFNKRVKIISKKIT